MADENVTATLTIAVPVAGVFAVLADPTIHSAIDGTGWVRDAIDREPLTGVGQIFRMDMYRPGHPDGDYKVANKVAVFEPPSAISWLTGQENADGQLELGGWFWRYDLRSVGPAETEVTLTYDWSAAPPHVRASIPFPPFGPDHLLTSLRHLAELAAAASPIRTPGARKFAAESGTVRRRWPA